MKKLLLPALILGAGAVALGRLTHTAAEAQAVMRRVEEERRAVRIAVVQLTADRAALRNDIKGSRERIRRLPAPVTTDSGLPGGPQSGPSNRWAQASVPELRHLLGLAWDNSPDYVLVSKESLKRMVLNGVQSRGSLTPAVCDVLAITPEEQARIVSLIQRSEAEYRDWMKTNVQRIAPSGDIVAQYVVPANPGLSEQLMMAGGVGMLGALGLERTELARNFALQWMQSHGWLGRASISLTVRRSSESGRLEARCDTVIGGGNSSTGYAELSPSSFPEVFRAVFPGGWRDLAQRENFELPQDFQDGPAGQ